MAHYRRILLKLSGEALGVKSTALTSAFNSTQLSYIAQAIAEVVAHRVQVGLVLGGGNWWRGSSGLAMGLQRVTADQIGMLATMLNALALQDFLVQRGLNTRIMSTIPIGSFAQLFNCVEAKCYLNSGTVMIFAGGTGHPFVSTDSAASLRALETEADILLKATSVDGIYSKDPRQYPDAVLYQQLNYTDVLAKELGVMDLTAFIQCRDYNLPIRVFNIHTPHALVDIIQGKPIGTLVSSDVETVL